MTMIFLFDAVQAKNKLKFEATLKTKIMIKDYTENRKTEMS